MAHASTRDKDAHQDLDCRSIVGVRARVQVGLHGDDTRKPRSRTSCQDNGISKHSLLCQAYKVLITPPTRRAPNVARTSNVMVAIGNVVVTKTSEETKGADNRRPEGKNGSSSSRMYYVLILRVSGNRAVNLPLVLFASARGRNTPASGTRLD